MELKCAKCGAMLRASRAQGPQGNEPVMQKDASGAYVVCACGERTSLEVQPRRSSLPPWLNRTTRR